MGAIKTSQGQSILVDQSFLHTASVLFDAVFIPAGKKSSDELIQEADALHFINEMYKHCKVIASEGEGSNVIISSYVGKNLTDKKASAGVLLDASTKQVIAAIAQHRFWEREKKSQVPA